MDGSIICGIDDSPDSRLVVKAAGDLARRLSARLFVAHVIADVRDPVPPGTAYAPMARPPLETTESARGPDADVKAAEALLEHVTLEADVDGAELRVLRGDPAHGLADLAQAEGAGLIVVGSRRRGPFKAAFLGSVSNGLVGLAGCPVLVVPRGVAEPALAA
jgi:nucleotide-binding universal stress UspA family protein